MGFGLRSTQIAVAVLAVLLSFPLSAQTTASPANRFLLVIETSRPMQRRAEGVLNTLQELLGSGLAGQLRPGDTLGLWTYNEQVAMGRLPLQRWSAEAQSDITQRVLGFMQAQKYEKPARLDPVIPALQHVVESSEFITVILVSSGTEIHGTPFDEALNQAYLRWRTQQQTARMPFVTALRAEGGKLVDYSVTPAPWPVELPALPAALRPATIGSASRPKPPAPAPLIISGKKPAAPPPAKPPETAGTNIASAVAPTPNQATASLPLSSSAVASPTAAEPNPPRPQARTEAVTVQPAPAPPPLTAQSQSAPAEPKLVPAKSVALPPESKPSPASASPVVKPVSVEPKPVLAKVETPLTRSKTSTQSTPIQPAPVASAVSRTAPPADSPAPATPAAKPVAPAPVSTPVTTTDQAQTNQVKPPAQMVAAASANQGFFSQRIVWLAAPGCVLVFALVWWWRVRSRPPARISLITRSLERKE